jgi:uncharacterized protein with PIN domain
VTADQMREWYIARDLLGTDGERVIPESSRFEDSVTMVLATLAGTPPLAPCPTRCPRCQAELR